MTPFQCEVRLNLGRLCDRFGQRFGGGGSNAVTVSRPKPRAALSCLLHTHFQSPGPPLSEAQLLCRRHHLESLEAHSGRKGAQLRPAFQLGPSRCQTMREFFLNRPDQSCCQLKTTKRPSQCHMEQNNCQESPA